MDNYVKIYECDMVIPTYAVGKEEKTPMFFEKRVYQGSSGKVYPNRVIEKIYDTAEEKTYKAVVLENKWVKVIVLPELGGRIYTAYDKTNGYDFVYHNKVIKPALVGLLGPWISGGIEFNWPQHHRPGTYKPVKHRIEKTDNSCVTVYVGEVENMFSLEQTTAIKLYSDRSYIEIATDVYNRSEFPQTFLWWANPAFRVNDYTRTIMPPDVTAVMDHGKRAVSSFPISTGKYYKYDYSEGVDISRYKNIPVPTSFMAYRSNFDFVGGYDDKLESGLLHVADHQISPGKKQWTWGAGEFGIAWDQNLTDSDGPYVELMTGCFTDNQPDFTYIQPQESKNFTQYFMPYHKVGAVKNANRDICFGTEHGELKVYSSIYTNVDILVERDGKEVFRAREEFYPTQSKTVCKIENEDKITLLYDNEVLSFTPNTVENFGIPSPATACPQPKKCKSCEELYMFGAHIEQYRHATRLAEDYYLEGLRRDNSDIRNNTAYGLLMLRRGNFAISQNYFKQAIKTATQKNPNPVKTESYYYLGLAHMFLKEYELAYDNFYKCVWANDVKAVALYMLAVISYVKKDYRRALEFIDKSIANNATGVRAQILKGNILLKYNDFKKAKLAFEAATVNNTLDGQSRFEISLLTNDFSRPLVGISAYEITVYASDYFLIQEYAKAEKMLNDWLIENNENNSMVHFYIAYALQHLSKDSLDAIKCAENAFFEGNIHFPSSTYDYIVMQSIVSGAFVSDVAFYYLGNFLYDKKRYSEAKDCWKKCVEIGNRIPTAYRNLALYYFNKERDEKSALNYMEQAFCLDKNDSRLLMELNCLYQILGYSEDKSYNLLTENLPGTFERDDLYSELIKYTLHKGNAEQAYEMITCRKFHPWEGGEGKVTKLYKEICLTLAKAAETEQNLEKALIWCEKSLVYPENLGEGKLILDYDNDVYYLLANLYEKIGDVKQANKAYSKAKAGVYDIAENMYYNDSPIEYVFYQALAYADTKEYEKAVNIANSFIEYADKNENSDITIDYFAVSLPDLLVWEQDINKRNNKFCKYLRSLADQIKVKVTEGKNEI